MKKMSDIDDRFKEFVLKNYKNLTENQRILCKEMGIPVPN